MAHQGEDVRNGRKAKLTGSDTGLWDTAQRWWRKSYAGDYLGEASCEDYMAGAIAIDVEANLSSLRKACQS